MIHTHTFIARAYGYFDGTVFLVGTDADRLTVALPMEPRPKHGSLYTVFVVVKEVTRV